MRVRLALLVVLGLTAAGGATRAEEFDCPGDGPPRQMDKSIIYVAFDFKNGGNSAVYRGLQEATRHLGWKLGAVDARGDRNKLPHLFAEVIDGRPDAIILGGFEPGMVESQFFAAVQKNIVMVGWHAAAHPGSAAGLFVNVTTEPERVAEEAVDAIVKHSAGRVGVVIFTDSQFSIANLKTEAMKRSLLACARCELLAVEDISITQAEDMVPKVVETDNRKFGARWTHSLAINDIYFDNMNYALHAIGREDISNVSAGDGSARAIGRIRSGRSRQSASVAEPLTLQGWQLADELNRAFAGYRPSGYVSQPILVTAESLKSLQTRSIDDALPFRRHFLANWMCDSQRAALTGGSSTQ